MRKPPRKATRPKNDGKSGGLLKSLASMFGSSDENAETAADDNETCKQKKTEKTQRAVLRIQPRQVPRQNPAGGNETFLPAGQSRISGITLRWIQAFANKVIEDPSVILEIRIDRTSSFELQQKRLNLLHNIFN